MNKKSLNSMRVFILFIILYLSHSAYPNSDIKIEDFVQLPASRDVQISPDGKHLSVIFRVKNEDRLFILNRDTFKPISSIRVRGARTSVGNVHWVSDKRLVYGVWASYGWNRGLFDHGELYAVNIDGSSHEIIFGYKSGEMQTGSKIKRNKAEYGNYDIIDLLENDPKHILISFHPWRLVGSYYRFNPRATTIIYKLNTYTGSKRKVDHLPIPGASAITDNNGKVRFAIGKNKENRQLVFFKNLESDEWQKFSPTDFNGENLSPISFTKDNDSVYLSANVDGGTKALYLFNFNDQSFQRKFHEKTVDISLFIRDFSDNRIIAVGTDLDMPKYHYLEKNDSKAKLHRMLLKSFKGNNVVITSSTSDANYAIAYVHSDINPGDYYLFDIKNLNAKYILSRHGQIDPELMSVTESLQIQARDGATIYGYLTKPNGMSKDLPLVVLPHGGPHGIRDYWEYNWEVQLLASRGYAVLQVNYRGSGGFGLDFERAGYGKWGTLMQDDITDATHAMIKQGITAPDRICIYGASYGGYAALMGVVREPSLYQCAIGSVGVYNLPMMFKKGDIPDLISGVAYLKEVLGNDINDQKARSPVYNVDKIKAQVLLIHGGQDERVPIEQAESLKDAFDDIGKKYQWLEMKNEGHGYIDEKNRLVVYKKILAFLDENIGRQSSPKVTDSHTN